MHLMRRPSSATTMGAAVSVWGLDDEPTGAVEEAEAHLRDRRDALPEYANYYRDSGCDLHDSCLTCPFERCRYDVAGGRRHMDGEPHRARILELRSQGMTVEAVGRAAGVSRRTVFRVLAAARA